MKTPILLCLSLSLLMSLSGCLAVICPDGKPVLDTAGRVLKVYTDNERQGSVEKNCSPKKPSIQNTTVQILQPPPLPTNLAPAVGAVGLAGAALLGAAGSGPASTTGTR